MKCSNPECKNEIRLRRADAKYCSTACQKRTHHLSKRKGTPVLRPFVALDGEGAKDKYILLGCGNGDSIGNKRGLSTEECLDFLLDLPNGSHAGGSIRPIYIWFAFDYDVNMMLGDIPFHGPNSITQLRETNEIRWHGYRIKYIRRKIFSVRRGKKWHKSVDVWGFFQSSFERALKDWGVESNEIIKTGKANRTQFSKWSLKRIKEYNDEELRLLAQLAEKLRDSVTPLELFVRSWHGPAALASAWLTKNKIRRYINNEIPAPVLDAASRAYFGGRIDVAGYGIVNPVYHYDIVSAYPAATRNLIDLSKVVWKRTYKQPPPGRVYLAKISWDLKQFVWWPPLPYRDTDGSIVYPPWGTGWYWNSEFEAVQRKFGKDQFQIEEVWVAEGRYEYPLRTLIDETFRYRAELKRQGHPSHKAVKLILNSLYGKFAQTVGNNNFFSSLWAGMITAHTRAQLTPAITNQTVCVMTDSIWSHKPLSVPLGSKLGDWEQQDENVLYLAEAGLYAATGPSGNTNIWQRGFDKLNAVDIPHIVSEWLYGDDFYSPSYKVNRFVGMGLASITHHPWRTWVELDRKIHPVPLTGTGKRFPFLPLDGTEDLTSAFRYLPSKWGLHQTEDSVSAPYSPLTLDPKLVELRMQDETKEEI